MKKLLILLISIFSTSAIAQVAPLLNPQSLRLPRFNSLAHITSTITSPEEGMLVYNGNTFSNWYYNNTTWVELNNSFSVPLSISSSSTTLTSTATGASGGAGNFQITNSSNPNPSLSGFTSGSRNALYAQTSGANNAASISVNNASNSSAAIFASHNGASGGYSVFGQNSGLGRAGYFQINNASNSSVALFAQTSGTGRAFEASSQSGIGGYFTSVSGYALVTGTGNVGIGTNTPSTKLEVNGYTKLGNEATAPKIKMKELTLTTSGSNNGSLSVAHGLTASKIISATVLVAETVSAISIPPAYDADPNLKYNFYFNSTNFFIQNQAANCISGSHICNKTATILITYKE